ncbi:MAG: glycosyltransferase, partial [Anaerolineales bacterium]
ADPSEPDSWVHCIEQLLEDHSLAQAISNKALQEFKAKYTWDARAKYIIDSLT